MTFSPDRVPVIIGIGEIADHPVDPADGLEPLALMAEAMRRAEADAGARLLGRVDSLDIVNQSSWPYAAPAAALCERLGIAPARAVYGPMGGESPIRCLHEAAARIAAGKSSVAAICGAEARNSLAKAQSAAITLPWTTPPVAPASQPRVADLLPPVAISLGVFKPVNVYPFYENASAAYWGQSPAEALAESGELWARSSRVAAENPFAWLPRERTAADIVTPGPANRPIAWPYTKLMVANPVVNQGAAVLVASLATARANGISEDRLIHVWGGAAANEPRNFLLRDQYRRSHAQDAVLETARARAADGFDALELYSCFPCVPKMARRTLGLGPDVAPTVTGGLTFFGAPLNNYMTHAICAMTRRLRGGDGVGLLYGQGEYVTKHHAVVVASRPPEGRLKPAEETVQTLADSRYGPVPAFSADEQGPAILETFTVIYDRDGAPAHGAVIVRTASGARSLARVPATDLAGIARLTNGATYPVDAPGTLRRAADGISEWRFDGSSAS